MNIPIQPILASLRHHRLTTALLMLQVALTCAIVCNVAFMVVNRWSEVHIDSGVDEASLSVLDSQGVKADAEPWIGHAEDLAALRGIPGVTAAIAVDTLPLGGSESSTGACASSEALEAAIKANSLDGQSACVQFATLAGSPGELATLGLKLIAGRDFLPDDYKTGDISAAIISRELAERLYPEKQALGKSLYNGSDTPVRIVGIVETLLRPYLRDASINQFTMLWPQLPNRNNVTYLLRSAPQDTQRVLKAAVVALDKVNPQRIIPAKYVRTYTQMRDTYFQRDTTMIGLLLASALGLLFVTVLGITGLANFWVQQRTRSIGIRRAIGATRGDILRYFQTENFLIVGAGIVLGMLLAFLLNAVLMQQYELPRLPLFYLPIGGLVLWGLGQLAVLGPALRAAAVPPMVATRSA
ncbi:MAG: FtsX-like permease family protein [Rhodanobacter sp.]